MHTCRFPIFRNETPRRRVIFGQLKFFNRNFQNIKTTRFAMTRWILTRACAMIEHNTSSLKKVQEFAFIIHVYMGALLYKSFLEEHCCIVRTPNIFQGGNGTPLFDFAIDLIEEVNRHIALPSRSYSFFRWEVCLVFTLE